MKDIKNELRLLNSSDEVLCSINTVTYYNEKNEFDEGETFFLHILTGSQCQEVEQVFQGWSEQDKELQEHWDILKNAIENDCDLHQKIWDLDTIDYYI